MYGFGYGFGERMVCKMVKFVVIHIIQENLSEFFRVIVLLLLMVDYAFFYLFNFKSLLDILLQYITKLVYPVKSIKT